MSDQLESVKTILQSNESAKQAPKARKRPRAKANLTLVAATSEPLTTVVEGASAVVEQPMIVAAASTPVREDRRVRWMHDAIKVTLPRNTLVSNDTIIGVYRTTRTAGASITVVGDLNRLSDSAVGRLTIAEVGTRNNRSLELLFEISSEDITPVGEMLFHAFKEHASTPGWVSAWFVPHSTGLIEIIDLAPAKDVAAVQTPSESSEPESIAA